MKFVERILRLKEFLGIVEAHSDEQRAANRSKCIASPSRIKPNCTHKYANGRYAVVRHTFKDGTVWVRCIPCGTLWTPALPGYKDALKFETNKTLPI